MKANGSSIDDFFNEIIEKNQSFIFGYCVVRNLNKENPTETNKYEMCLYMEGYLLYIPNDTYELRKTIAGPEHLLMFFKLGENISFIFDQIKKSIDQLQKTFQNKKGSPKIADKIKIFQQFVNGINKNYRISDMELNNIKYICEKKKYDDEDDDDKFTYELVNSDKYKYVEKFGSISMSDLPGAIKEICKFYNSNIEYRKILEAILIAIYFGYIIDYQNDNTNKYDYINTERYCLQDQSNDWYKQDPVTKDNAPFVTLLIRRYKKLMNI